MNKPITIFWHRRDLRIHDNRGLYESLQGTPAVQPIFIFDIHILEPLPSQDARVQFIRKVVTELKEDYRRLGSDLWVFYGKPEQVFKDIINSFSVHEVYTNQDFEPYAVSRDQKVKDLLASKGVLWHAYTDHVILDYTRVLKDDGKPYTVFTPYSRKWRKVLSPADTQFYDVKAHARQLNPGTQAMLVPSLEQMGFKSFAFDYPKPQVNTELISEYSQNRNFPALPGTSKLGIHFRFGTLSVREYVRTFMNVNTTWISELIWRDFYAQILAHFPHVKERAFKPEYEGIVWRNNQEEFERWKEGKTGVAIVDAGMRELNNTGFMHNRVRMIVASYLCKNLLIDWRWGEAYFAEKLLDFDLASNNGGWQWAAGSGVDAAPYFRIFNPALQTQKFDPKAIYIKKWVPEFESLAYAQSVIIDHPAARERCLNVYKQGLGKS